MLCSTSTSWVQAMSKRVVVLGAGGFIGRHICRQLARHGCDVVAAIRTPGADIEGARHTECRPFDDAAHFVDLVGESDWFIHAASSSTPGASASKPDLELSTNLQSGIALALALQQHPTCKVLYLSSGGTVYGDCGDRRPDEDEALRPRSYYGAGKAAVEMFLRAWCCQFGGRAVVIRPSNVYGPGQASRPGFGVIPAALASVVDGEPLTIWGGGSQVRDYLFVQDLVELVMRIIRSPVPAGFSVFNASNGRGATLRDLLALLEVVVERRIECNYSPGREVDVNSIVPESLRAWLIYEWRSVTSLEDGLRATWNWWQQAHDSDRQGNAAGGLA